MKPAYLMLTALLLLGPLAATDPGGCAPPAWPSLGDGGYPYPLPLPDATGAGPAGEPADESGPGIWAPGEPSDRPPEWVEGSGTNDRDRQFRDSGAPDGEPPDGGVPDGEPPDSGVPDGAVVDVGNAAPAAPGPGQVIFTEFMNNPASSPDLLGEWIELYNRANTTYDLNGCELRDADRDRHRVVASLLIRPGEHLWLARSAGAAPPHSAADYVYDGLRLANTVDELMLYCADVLIDEVRYGSARGFPAAVGASISLDVHSTTDSGNDHGANWCVHPAPAAESAGGSPGTPGEANAACPAR